MASEAPISRWLLDRSNDFGLTFTELTWGKNLSRAVFDFELEATIAGKAIVGRGSDFIEDFALEKACAEFVERSICLFHGISTDGVAVHTSAAAALEGSVLEANERACLKWHFDRREPFLQMPVGFSDAELRTVVANVGGDGASLQLRSLNATSDRKGVVALVKSGTERFIGAAMALTVADAAEKASYEAARNLASYVSDPLAFHAEVSANPALWICDKATLRRYDPLFQNLATSRTPKFEFESSMLSLPADGNLRDFPFFACRTKIKWELT